MKTIDGHTFDENYLTDGGWIIDVGARGFKFSEYFYRLRGWNNEKHNVYAIDIEDFTKESFGKCDVFKHAALSDKKGTTEAFYFGDGSGNFIKGINETPYNGPDRPCETRIVNSITLQDIYNEIGIDIDLLKLDAEGIEYFVLQNFKPIPRMITVETHQHCHEHLHNRYWDDIVNDLCKNYRLSLHSVTPRYPYMDCLFIRKDLI